MKLFWVWSRWSMILTYGTSKRPCDSVSGPERWCRNCREAKHSRDQTDAQRILIGRLLGTTKGHACWADQLEWPSDLGRWLVSGSQNVSSVTLVLLDFVSVQYLSQSDTVGGKHIRNKLADKSPLIGELTEFYSILASLCFVWSFWPQNKLL